MVQLPFCRVDRGAAAASERCRHWVRTHTCERELASSSCAHHGARRAHPITWFESDLDPKSGMTGGGGPGKSATTMYVALMMMLDPHQHPAGQYRASSPFHRQPSVHRRCPHNSALQLWLSCLTPLRGGTPVTYFATPRSLFLTPRTPDARRSTLARSHACTLARLHAARTHRCLLVMPFFAARAFQFSFFPPFLVSFFFFSFFLFFSSLLAPLKRPAEWRRLRESGKAMGSHHHDKWRLKKDGAW